MHALGIREPQFLHSRRIVPHQAPPDDAQLWGRSRLGALADVAEWREWFTLLARRSLALREAGEAGTAVAERAQRGDARAPPDELAYWRLGEI